MTRFLYVATMAGSLLLISGAAFGGGGCSENESCSDAGCESAVDVALVNKVDPAPGVTRVRACAEGACERVRLGRGVGGASLPIEDPGERDVELELTVVGGNGQMLARDAETVTLKKLQPNGPDCDPTCYSASRSYDIQSLDWDQPADDETA